MKKSSMIFRIICMAVCFAFALSCVSVMAEEVEETVVETTETVTDDVNTDETQAPEASDEVVGDESVEGDAEDEIVEDEIVEDEVLDLFSATLRDGGIYVTPGEDNAAVFTYDNLRYKVEAGAGNLVKLNGFEEDVTIKEEISETAKNVLQANAEITTGAAHSGYFGLSVSEGDVIYRTAVTGGDIYVFSAWINMPANGSISEDDRAFRVIGESGKEYIVGWNEVGDEEAWQQVIFTFKAPEEGLFQIDFGYKGKAPMAIDDIELYEAEIFNNPLTIDTDGVLCIDAEGNQYTRKSGFTTSGTLTHKTTLYNSDEDDVYFTAVAVVYKNDIMIDFVTSEECALVLDETEVTLEIEIPEDEDLSQYKYMVYFISDTEPTQYYGEMLDVNLTYPYIVSGK